MPINTSTEAIGAPSMTYTEAMTECWCNKLSYKNYVAFVNKLAVHCVPEQSYKLHCQAMDIDRKHNSAIESEEFYPNGLMF